MLVVDTVGWTAVVMYLVLVTVTEVRPGAAARAWMAARGGREVAESALGVASDAIVEELRWANCKSSRQCPFCRCKVVRDV